MFLLQEQLGYDQDYTSQLLGMVRFNSLIYVPYWLTASIGADAPINDLILYKKLLKYKELDAEVAEIAISKLSLHLWYLTEEVVAFALFSNKLDNDDKARMAAKLLTYALTPGQLKIGKPTFPKLNAETTLASFVGSRS